MANHIDRIDQVRVASPCPANWDQMSGDNRVRFCNLCQLQVYNISDLSRREANALLTSTNERLCARLFRRADGTIMTKDCPVGVRAIRRRLSRVAVTVSAALISICSNVFPRTLSGLSPHQGIQTLRTNSPALAPAMVSAVLSGTITDPNGDPIKGATITLINQQTHQKQELKSDRKGAYRFQVSQFGSYSIKVTASSFGTYERTLPLHLGDDLRLEISLMLAAVVGVIVFDGPPRSGYDLDGVHIRINEKR